MRQSTRQSGVILPLVALLMVVIFGFVAFAVDIGYVKLARTQLQAAADAGARAGVLALGGGPSDAKQLAQNAAQDNEVAGSAVVVLPQEDIELGRWDTVTRVFTPLSGADESNADSVRITCRCLASRTTAVPTFFARAIGTDSVDVAASAIARSGAICGVFVGVERVETNGGGTYTDSYNAAIGSYGSQPAGDNGHICSDGDIVINSGTINGNAIPGQGDTVSIGQGTVTGSTTPRTSPLTLSPVDFGDVATNNDNGDLASPPYDSAIGEFRIENGSYSIPPGTYYLNTFTIGGNATVTVTGPTTIYVTDSVLITGGGLVNDSQLPKNLKILSSGSSIRVAGNSTFYGVIYAPNADIEVAGASDFYGGAMGRSLTIENNGGVHADESLPPLEEVPSQPILVQ